MEAYLIIIYSLSNALRAIGVGKQSYSCGEQRERGTKRRVVKMNDNDVIKALECCGSNCCSLHEGCPLWDFGDDSGIAQCTSELVRNALDLINRLQAEIEVLQNDVSFLDKHNDELIEDNDKLKAEIERLKGENKEKRD